MPLLLGMLCCALRMAEGEYSGVNGCRPWVEDGEVGVRLWGVRLRPRGCRESVAAIRRGQALLVRLWGGCEMTSKRLRGLEAREEAADTAAEQLRVGGAGKVVMRPPEQVLLWGVRGALGAACMHVRRWRWTCDSMHGVT